VLCAREHTDPLKALKDDYAAAPDLPDPPRRKIGDPPRFSLFRHRGRQFGVDVDGNQSVHSLLPRGMATRRSVGRAVRPRCRAAPGGVADSDRVVLTLHGKPSKTQAHRTFQTIQPLGQRLGVPIQSPLPEGQEFALVAPPAAMCSAKSPNNF
jgi:hypothetical protein